MLGAFRQRQCRYAARTAMPSRALMAAKSGVAALEFALLAPVLIALTLGIFCLALYFTYIHEVQELASGAVRSSVAGINPTERDTLARQFIATAISTNSFLVSANLIVGTVSVGTPATSYAVTVSYNLNGTPIPAIADLLDLPIGTITRTSTIQFGNF